MAVSKFVGLFSAMVLAIWLDNFTVKGLKTVYTLLLGSFLPS
jgi:hypothetical protein